MSAFRAAHVMIEVKQVYVRAYAAASDRVALRRSAVTSVTQLAMIVVSQVCVRAYAITSVIWAALTGNTYVLPLPYAVVKRPL